MIVSIEPDAVLPPYEQLRRQIAGMITLGALAPGDRLPSIRQLAADLHVAPGTVARAYRELRVDGLVRQRPRHGTVVADDASRPPPDGHQRDKLARAATTYAATAGETGHTLEDALAEVRRAFAHLGDDPA